jgi:hypothetical protein
MTHRPKRNRRAGADIWTDYADAGDQWLAAYAAIPFEATWPVLFSVGHALELYLKAIKAKVEGIEPDHAHNVEQLWTDAVKVGALPPHLHFRPSHFKAFRDGKRVRDILKNGGITAEVWEFQERIELFPVLAAIRDLKYLPLQSDQLTTTVGLVVIRPNLYWAGVFRAMRLWLHWPDRPANDLLRRLVASGEIREHGAAFVRAMTR